MNYAPVLIPTLNRYDSLRRCLDSLKANKWAKYTDVIIAVDKPVRNHQIENNKRIIKYLSENNFPEFKNLKIIIRRRNYGAVRNFERLVEGCFAEYDRCICVFDDLELSPNFIEYMDRVLDEYENNPCIVGISGYSYPIKWETSETANMFKQNFVASIWGIAFWKTKFKKMYQDIHKGRLVAAYDRIYETGFKNMTDWAVKDYTLNLCHGITKKSFLTSITDIAMRIYLTVDNKYFITPTLSKVRNHGFDGSGEFCEKITSDAKVLISSNYNYGQQPIDTEDCFYPRLDQVFDIDVNRSLFNCFDYVSPELKEMVKAEAAKYYKRSRLDRCFLNIKHFFDKIQSYIKRKLA